MAAAPMAHLFLCLHTRDLPEAELVLSTRGTLIVQLQIKCWVSNMDNLPQISISPVHMAWDYHHTGRDQRCALQPSSNFAVKGKAFL